MRTRCRSFPPARWRIVACGTAGERRIPIDRFFLGIYETALAADELLVAIEIPVFSPGEVYFFRQHARRRGDYALAGLAARATLDHGQFAALRLAFFSVGDRPLPATAAAQALIGCDVTGDVLSRAQAALDGEADPHDDLQAPAEMRRYLMRGLLTAAVDEMLGRS